MFSSTIRVTIHAGEPGASIPGTRQRIEQAWGATAYDHAGMTEMGAYGFMCLQQRGLHVNEDEFIAEILDVQTGRPVKEGQTGELVLTNLGRWGSPAIHYRTGDLVRHGGYKCPCGRSFLHLDGGVLGRVDDMLIVRGVNIFPSSIEQILHSFPEIEEFRVTARRLEEMDQLTIEIEDRLEQPARVADECHVRLGLNVDVRCVPLGSLPRNDGKARRFMDMR